MGLDETKLPEFPPRVTISTLKGEMGEQIAVFRHDRSCFIPDHPSNVEYLSKQESESLLTAAVAKARAEEMNFWVKESARQGALNPKRVAELEGALSEIVQLHKQWGGMTDVLKIAERALAAREGK